MDPLTIGLLGTSLLSGLFGGGAKKKQAKAQKDADKRKYESEKAFWDASEAERVQQRRARTNAGGSILQNVQGSLGGGAPNYTLDPATLEALGSATPRPYAGSLPADPTAGMGSSLVSGLFGDAADVLAYEIAGKRQPGTRPAPQPGVGTQPAGSAAWSPMPVHQPGQQSTISGGANAGICAQIPYFPGCPGGMNL